MLSRTTTRRTRPPEQLQETAAPDRRRPLAGLTALATLVTLLAFSLPFASASCGSTRSESLTGWELVVGAEAALVPSDQPAEGPPEEERDQIRESMGAVASAARFAVVLVGFALLGTVFLAARPATRTLSRVQLGLSTGAALAMCMLWTAGAGFATADVHHHLGLTLATISAWLAAFVQLLHFGFWIEHVPWWLLLFCGAVAAAPLAFLAFVLGGLW